MHVQSGRALGFKSPGPEGGPRGVLENFDVISHWFIKHVTELEADNLKQVRLSFLEFV